MYLTALRLRSESTLPISDLGPPFQSSIPFVPVTTGNSPAG